MRNKLYTAINIIGLSIGLATFIFIFLFIRDEMTYDKHHEKQDRIYRLESDFTISGTHDRFAIVPMPMGPAFKIEFPEVENFVRLMDVGDALIKYEDKEYYEDNFYICDSTIFDVFTHKFVFGTPDKALTEPNTIVLTKSIAEKYFGDENPLGKVMTTGDGDVFKVTAVIEDVPANSHLKFDALFSTATLAEEAGVEEFNSFEPVRFWNLGVFTYVLLHKNSSIESIYERFQPFYDKYMKPIGDQFNASFELLTTPLADTHFSAGLSAELPTGNMAYIYIFSAVALFILLIAAINYMNMATARSVKRAREVGIRKVVGAHRAQLVRQFLSESVLLTIVALVIALIMVFVLLHDFNMLSGKDLVLNIFSQPVIIIVILLVTIVVGIISGSYPAFYLSAFRPIVVLRGRLSGSGRKGGLLRKILVVFQFFIAIVMIIATMVVSGQLNFLRNKNLGFQKENLVVLQLQDSAFRSKADSFKEELLQNPSITGVTKSTGVPGNIQWIQVVLVEKESGMEDNTMILALTDYEFLDVMDMELVEGRNFDRDMGTDAREAVLINEAGVKSLGWTENPIGKKIHWGFDLEKKGGRMLKVIGVVKDFHFRSLHNPIEPIILFIGEDSPFLGLLSIRITGENVRETLDFIGEKWNEFGAKRPFDYTFLGESMDEMYQAEDKLARIFRIATILTIFVALLGLLGLSSFVTEQRYKEIGIRKILGASVGNVVGLLIREFVLLIIIAFIIAIPVAWWRLDVWIDSTFIYRDNINWIIFVLAGIIALIVGLLTMSFYVLRAASSNPVDAIKYE